LRYILDPSDVMGEDYPSETFRVLKDKEKREFGEYRTQRLVLREFDRMALAQANGDAYISLLNPPPGVQVAPIYSTHGVLRDEADAHLAGLMLTMIQQARRLPRRELTQALTLACQPDLQASFIDTKSVALLRLFMRQHPGVFDDGRLAGGRLQQWVRHFESTGVIRLDAANDTFELVQASALPNDVRVTDTTEQVATLLIQSATLAFTGMASIGGDLAATPAAKQG